MALTGLQEQLRFKLTAFVFNSKADALRGEIYRALCLYVLSEADEALDEQGVSDMVAYTLGAGSSASNTLRAVILETLAELRKSGDIQLENGGYSLNDASGRSRPDTVTQERMNEAISQDIRAIALALNPTLSVAQLKALVEFYIEISSEVAKQQVRFLARGYRVQSAEPDNGDIRTTIAESRELHGVDQMVDIDEFVRQTLIRPTEVLASYLYSLIQVNVLTQLLAWDPALENLQSTVLSRKTLYLDSSIIFVLTQTTHPSHDFLKCLLQASRDALGVRLKVHETTLREYRAVLEWHDAQFASMQHYLRDVATICKRQKDDPTDHFESSIFTDYVARNIDHVDERTWRKYLNLMGGEAFDDTLKSLAVEVDRSSVYVPDKEFMDIKGALERASMVQVQRGRRSRLKSSLDHDAKLYYWINNVRAKRNGELSLGYDTYLLTLDGSLVHFRKYYDIDWYDTYFLYPNQWYELTFPLLRIRSCEIPRFASGLASLVFSKAFPALTMLIPLELCAYVFDQGGTDLATGSLRNVVEALVERKLVDSLDPANNDKRKREEAKLQVQRLIAIEQMSRDERLRALDDETKKLRSEEGVLSASIEQLAQTQTSLTQQVAQREAEIGAYQQVDEKITALNAQHASELKRRDDQHAAELLQLHTELEQERQASAEKDKKIAKQGETSLAFERRIAEMQRSLSDVQKTLESQTEKETVQKDNRNRLRQTVKRGFIDLCLLAGMVFTFYGMITSGTTWYVIVGSSFLMALGIVLYNLVASPWWAFLAYMPGLIIAVFMLLAQRRYDLWMTISALVFEVVAFGIDRLLSKPTEPA